MINVVVNNNFLHNRINAVPKTTQVKTPDVGASSASGFGKILEESIKKQNELKFSKHAMMRLQDRSIFLTDSQKDRISSAIDKAGSKGVKDTLILMDNMALIANVPNRTIITAAKTDELKESVFTNIDGAVMA